MWVPVPVWVGVYVPAQLAVPAVVPAVSMHIPPPLKVPVESVAKPTWPPGVVGVEDVSVTVAWQVEGLFSGTLDGLQRSTVAVGRTTLTETVTNLDTPPPLPVTLAIKDDSAVVDDVVTVNVTI